MHVQMYRFIYVYKYVLIRGAASPDLTPAVILTVRLHPARETLYPKEAFSPAHRGTSLIRTPSLLEFYARTIPRVI